MKEILTDENLAEKAKRGDEFAMEELLLRYKDLVKKLARRYFLAGGENEDLIQEGMIGLSKAILSYSKNQSNFRAFATLCATRKIQSEIKIANRKKHQILNNAYSLDIKFGDTEKDDELILLIPSSELEPEQSLIAKEKYEQLKTFIKNGLSQLEQDILSYYLQGLSYAEIGKKLKKDAKSIENGLNRLRTKILSFKNKT